jgi:DNA-binding GntR family transcriptional regulator
MAAVKTVRQTPAPPSVDTDAIHTRIAEAIAAHRLPPGTKLGEEALGEIFGVSRTKIRQALFQLAGDKLVTLIPGRGAFVAQPSVREAREVFEARRVIEAAIVTRFLELATTRDMEALAEHIALEEEAIEAGNAQSRNRLLGDFHEVIARIAGNAVLTEILSELVARTSLITLFYQNTRGAAESLEEHRQLLKAIRKRDIAASVALMHQHLSNVERGLVLREEAPAGADLRTALGSA